MRVFLVIALTDLVMAVTFAFAGLWVPAAVMLIWMFVALLWIVLFDHRTP